MNSQHTRLLYFSNIRQPSTIWLKGSTNSTLIMEQEERRPYQFKICFDQYVDENHYIFKVLHGK